MPPNQPEIRAVFTGPGNAMQFEPFDTPVPGSGELTARVEMAGICGTDAHRLAGDIPYPGHPVCFGHEAVGRIEALGEGVHTDWAGEPVAVDDRIYWNPVPHCGKCRSCVVTGIPTRCENLRWPASADGSNAAGFQTVAVVSARNEFHRVPDGTSAAAVIALGCALPTAIGGFDRLGTVEVGQTVVIQGSGPVGLAATLLATATPAAQIIVIGAPANRLELARELGATATLDLTQFSTQERLWAVRDLTGGRGADVVIEAAGHPSAFPQGLDLLGVGGRYLILGLYCGVATAPVDPVRINNENLTILGSLGSPVGTHRRAIAAVRRAPLDLGRLVTHRFPLPQLVDAIATARSGTAVKAVVSQPCDRESNR